MPGSIFVVPPSMDDGHTLMQAGDNTRAHRLFVRVMRTTSDTHEEARASYLAAVARRLSNGRLVFLVQHDLALAEKFARCLDNKWLLGAILREKGLNWIEISFNLKDTERSYQEARRCLKESEAIFDGLVEEDTIRSIAENAATSSVDGFLLTLQSRSVRDVHTKRFARAKLIGAQIILSGFPPKYEQYQIDTTVLLLRALPFHHRWRYFKQARRLVQNMPDSIRERVLAACFGDAYYRKWWRAL